MFRENFNLCLERKERLRQILSRKTSQTWITFLFRVGIGKHRKVGWAVLRWRVDRLLRLLQFLFLLVTL